MNWLVPDWPAPSSVRALSTFRTGGVSSIPYASLNLGAHVGDAPSDVAENRRRLVHGAGLPVEPSWLVQVHGTAVARLDEPGAELESPADASIARRPGRVCAILTADCLPVLFAAESGAAVAAAHAGWRGLAAGVLEATVRALDAAPASLLAWLGPAIGPNHFEVGPEVREEFLRQDPAAARAFVPNLRGRFMADLPALARSRLARLGIHRVFGGEACTFGESGRYFSHRREGRTGRQATLIWLEDSRSARSGRR
jgi:polyphenol oxidase